MTPRLIYIHIGKTGGTAFTRALKLKVPAQAHFQLPNPEPHRGAKQLTDKTWAELHDIRCVSGHMPIGFADILPGPSKYLTLLRHPVERVLSAYYYWERNPGLPVHIQIKSGSMPLEKFASEWEPGNLMTRMLLWHDVHHEWFWDRRRIDRPDLLMAQRNLRALFCLVGITELFDETLDELERVTGWSYSEEERQGLRGLNTTPNRPAREDHAPEIIAKIEERNAVDLELYHWALERFRDNLEEPDDWRETRHEPRQPRP